MGQSGLLDSLFEILENQSLQILKYYLCQSKYFIYAYVLQTDYLVGVVPVINHLTGGSVQQVFHIPSQLL